MILLTKDSFENAETSDFGYEDWYINAQQIVYFYGTRDVRPKMVLRLSVGESITFSCSSQRALKAAIGTIKLAMGATDNN
jgi:hypothetical protein